MEQFTLRLRGKCLWGAFSFLDINAARLSHDLPEETLLLSDENALSSGIPLPGFCLMRLVATTGGPVTRRVRHRAFDSIYVAIAFSLGFLGSPLHCPFDQVKAIDWQTKQVSQLSSIIS